MSGDNGHLSRSVICFPIRKETVQFHLNIIYNHIIEGEKSIKYSLYNQFEQQQKRLRHEHLDLFYLILNNIFITKCHYI